MNNLVKSTFRLSALKSLVAPISKSMGRREFTRTLWHMSKGAESQAANSILLHKPSMSCTCGCGSINQVHTKGMFSQVEPAFGLIS